MGLQGRFQGHRKSISRLFRWLISHTNGDSSLGHTILVKEPAGIKRRFGQMASSLFSRINDILGYFLRKVSNFEDLILRDARFLWGVFLSRP